MKDIKKEEDKSSVIKDYIQGIIFLGIPILIIYLIIKYA
jgi:hypothetical protein